MEEFNSQNLENEEDRNTIDVPNNQAKYISTRKRKELVNVESDDERNNENNCTPKIKIQNEESKEEEKNKCLNENQKQNYEYNKYKTIDRNINEQNNNIPAKNKTALQEKLKKIFMNRDKVKFQYAKQDIPDNLKYNSDESEDSENDLLRKSKVSKKYFKNFPSLK